MTKCECGHESCFHHGQITGVRAMFNQPPTKICNVEKCPCLRYTKVE